MAVGAMWQPRKDYKMSFLRPEEEKYHSSYRSLNIRSSVFVQFFLFSFLSKLILLLLLTAPVALIS
jgi:hypothetical protein